MVQLGILAIAMLLAGFATLLQRRPVPIPDWPLSSISHRNVRRDLIVTSAAVLFIIGAVAVAALAITTLVLQVVSSGGGSSAG